MIDTMEILKRNKGEMLTEKILDFCGESIILIARTFKLKPSKLHYNCSYTKESEKVFQVEVMVDGRTVHEYWDTDKDAANADWKRWKEHCEG